MALSPHVKDLAAKVSNWGRWGADDRRGTLNLIDQAAVQRGLAAARQGKTFLLSIPYDEDGPQIGVIPGRVNPERTMLCINQSMTGDQSDFCTSDDAVTMGVQAATHWDALAHAGYDDLLYNGVPASTIDERGAHELGVDKFGTVVSRGILLDVPRALGLEYLEGGYAITGDDLDKAAALGNITVQPGDIVLVHTGHMRHLFAGDKVAYVMTCPGPSTKSVEWLRDHDVAAIATDTITFEVFPCEDPDVMLPVHLLHLRDMGLVQGQVWKLDALAADCAADGQYDFLLDATPLPMTRAVGGAVAPVAVK